MRGCHNVVREVSRLFGLAHCVYYECLMNGFNNPAEQRRGGIKPLCPVCQKKLKLNLRFDCAKRFRNLQKVCQELGFDDEAAIYKRLIERVGAF